ncbi:STAS domain-containing protein [Streptomyces sp. NPDC012888]|uniref:STAS domain-containing protein n=1 Tax=Streptomyces sp. NPDC012888 TaxID=3364855 RepID=UPI0036B9F2D0
MNPFQIIVRDAPTGPVLTVVGELDYATAHELRAVVPTVGLRPGQCLTVDLARLEFCDSSGITALLAARHHARAAQADIALTAVPSNTLRILRMTGLDQVFTLQP